MVITPENVGIIVRDTRKALGLTQVELAERAGCSQRFVSELERGKATGEFCRVLAVFGALNIQLTATNAFSSDVDEELSRIESTLVSPVKNRSLHLVDFL